MKRMALVSVLVLALSPMAGPVLAGPAPAEEASMPAPIVFFDIAAPELAKQAAFYKAVFDWEADAGGGITVPVASPLPGNLRVEPATEGPTAERVLYVGVPDIDAALAKITANGGAVVFGRMSVPGVVILALFTDPAGNRMGLVEIKDGKPVVPPKG
jgi:hypothetical protein